jgi:hypothetical protein
MYGKLDNFVKETINAFMVEGNNFFVLSSPYVIREDDLRMDGYQVTKMKYCSLQGVPGAPNANQRDIIIGSYRRATSDNGLQDGCHFLVIATPCSKLVYQGKEIDMVDYERLYKIEPVRSSLDGGPKQMKLMLVAA